MRDVDSRLDRPVSLKFRRAAIQEVLTEIGKQTGVRLVADSRDTSADELVAVFCEGTPAAKILNAIWATMSYQGAGWQWRRVGAAGAFRYELSQSAGAQRLRMRLREDVDKLLSALDGKGEEREAVLKKVYGEPEMGFEKYYAFSKERLWNGLESFRNALSPEQRSSVLQGDLVATVPLAAVGDGPRAYYDQMHQQLVDRQVATGGSAAGLPRPEAITFARDQYTGTPALQIQVPNAAGGLPVVGGIPIVKDFWARMKSLWLVEGDAAEDPAEERLMVRPPDLEPEPPVSSRRPSDRTTSTAIQVKSETMPQRLSRRLEQVSLGARVPVVARLHQDPSRQGLTEPWSITLREYWKRTWNADLMKKWHDGVQIVSVISWPMEDAPIPGAFVERLRRDSRSGELLPIEDLLDAANQFSRTQLTRLAEEFPTMRNLAQNRWFVALAKRYPSLAQQAQAPGGLPLAPSVLRSLAELFPAHIIEAMHKTGARSLSFSVAEGMLPAEPARYIRLTFSGANGQPLGSFTFADVPQPKLTPRDDLPKPAAPRGPL